MQKFVEKFAQICDIIARFMVFIMMVLIVVNVVGRAVFRNPVPGAIEWVEFISAIAIGFALAYCGYNQGHIAVTFIVEKLPLKVQKVWEVVVDLIILAFIVLVVWRLGVYAYSLQMNNQVSLTTRTPYYIFVYLVAVGFGAYGVVALYRLIEACRKLVSK